MKSPFLFFQISYHTTSNITIFNGYFKVHNQSYYFVYHTYKNVYNSLGGRVRTKNGLLKPKSTIESFSVERETFVHTYDNATTNSSIYASFRKALREIYAPKLSSFVEGVLRPRYRQEDSRFADVYRQKLLETLVESADRYLRAKGYSPFEFSPQNISRNTTVHTYRSRIDGYMNYEKYDFNSTKPEGNESSLFMYDVVTLRYPEGGEKTCTFTVIITDEKSASYERTFKIKSIDIMIAFKANLSSFPVHVYRHLDKWKFTKNGLYSKIELYDFNPFYQFVVNDVQIELAKLFGSVLIF